MSSQVAIELAEDGQKVDLTSVAHQGHAEVDSNIVAIGADHIK